MTRTGVVDRLLSVLILGTLAHCGSTPLVAAPIWLSCAPNSQTSEPVVLYIDVGRKQFEKYDPQAQMLAGIGSEFSISGDEVIATDKFPYGDGNIHIDSWLVNRRTLEFKRLWFAESLSDAGSRFFYRDGQSGKCQLTAPQRIRDRQF